MPTHRHDATTGATHIAEEQLENAGSADDLHAGGVLRPSDSVDDGAGALAIAVVGEEFGDAIEFFDGAAADFLDNFRRVSREVFLQELEGAARMLKGWVFGDMFTGCWRR